MTNLEAAKAAIGANYPWEDATFKLGIVSSGLDPDTPVTPGRDFDIALAALILFLITAADVQEGGYSVKLDRTAMLNVRKTLLAKWDVAEGGGPTLRDRTHLW